MSIDLPAVLNIISHHRNIVFGYTSRLREGMPGYQSVSQN